MSSRCDELTIRNLLEMKKDIMSFMFTHKDELNAMKNTRILDYDAIIDLSKRISRTIRAPPLWQPGLPLDNSFGHAPCPQLEELTGGLLRKYQLLLKNDEFPVPVMTQPIDSVVDQTEASVDQVEDKKDTNQRKRNLSEILNHLGINNVSSSIVNTTSRGNSSSIATDVKTVPQVNIPSIAATADQRPEKKARNIISLSFGLSDSESDDE